MQLFEMCQTSELKPCFEPYRNNRKAAELYREWLARRLIGSIVTVNVIPSSDKTIRTFVNVRTVEDQGYVSTEVALRDHKEQVLSDLYSEVVRIKNKYKMFKELAQYIESLEEITSEIATELK